VVSKLNVCLGGRLRRLSVSKVFLTEGQTSVSHLWTVV